VGAEGTGVVVEIWAISLRCRSLEYLGWRFCGTVFKKDALYIVLFNIANNKGLQFVQIQTEQSFMHYSVSNISQVNLRDVRWLVDMDSGYAGTLTCDSFRQVLIRFLSVWVVLNQD
jgi:uncharacterized protein YdaL